jgi:hypothetical protein
MTAALNRNYTNGFIALAGSAMQGRSLKQQALQLVAGGRAPVAEAIRVASELGD